MKEIKTIKEIQEIQEITLDILSFIVKICEENDIRYYLAYGTLLGAVRHGGFIPWDDDVDLVMPRKDFIKLCEVLKANPHPYYKVVSAYTDKDFNAPLPKIIDCRTTLKQFYGFIEKTELGVYVDIFLIDGAPGNYEESLRHYRKAYRRYLWWMKADIEMFPPGERRLFALFRWICRIPYKIRGYLYWLRKFEVFCSQYSYDDSEYVSVYTAGTPGAERNVWSKSMFGSGIKMKFENLLVSVPEKYEELLKLEYGNYMQLPPEEQRYSHHKYLAYRK